MRNSRHRRSLFGVKTAAKHRDRARGSRRSRFEQLDDRCLLSATPLGNDYQLNTTVNLDQRAVAIGSHPQSTQVITAWVSAGEDGSGDGVYAQRHDLYGNRVGSPFRINGTTSGNQAAPAVAMDSLGNFVVAWQSSDGSGDGVFARRFGFDATPLANEFRVNSSTSGAQQAPSIAMADDGRFAVAFQSANRDGNLNAVIARVYSATGVALAADFVVNQFTTGNQQAPSIAMSSSGEFIVAWQSAGQDSSGDAVVARRYGNTGTALANEFVVNQTTSGNQSAPSAAANSDGSFVVAWQSANQDGSGDAVVARRYDSAGTALAPEFVVNQFSTGNQSAPSVSAALGAGFVIAWQSAGQDSNGDAVVARKYDAAGTAVDNEFVVNTFTTGAQNNPAVAIEGDGDFLVAWQSPGQETGGGSSLGVFARRYTAANDAPVMRQIQNQVTDLGGTVSFVAQARDQDLDPDQEIDTLSYSLAAGAPAGASIDPDTGAFIWSTHEGILPGRYFVTIVASDLLGLVDEKQVAITVFGPGERTALDDFVNAIDPAYKWDIRGRTIGAGFTKYDVLLTSGTWRTLAEVNRPTWQHWMAVYVPDVITQSKALVYIDGGDNSSNPPTNSDLDDYAGPIAANMGAVFVDLFTVPNQTLQFAGEAFSRREDSIIAYSWRKYLETGDETWPANLPMTRAALRAMDAISDFIGSPVGGDFDIDSFAVAGASKRGWTTWLASATDPRVSDAIPVVADLLNSEASFVHHYAYYNGNFSAAVNDYVNEGILDIDNFGRDDITTLLSIVDPYSYRDRLTLPKYMLNASGDEFFVPDSSSFYYNDLPGPKSMRYLPNSSHGISDINYIFDTLNVFQTMILGGSLPEYSFQQLPDGTIELTTSQTVVDAKLWKATNSTSRDFRWPVVGAAFTSTTLIDQGGGVFQGNVPTPPSGWTAYFIEVAIDNPLGAPIRVTSGVYFKGPPTNVQPVLDPINDLVIGEGSPLALQLVASDADAAQSLTYSLEPGAPPQLSIHSGSGLVSGTWNDQVSGFLSATVTVWDNGSPPLPDRDTFRISVVNVAPTAAISGPTSVSPGASESFTLLASDPSSADQAAGFAFNIDWDNDGTFDESLIGSSGTTISHAFAAGVHTVRVVATDKDFGISVAATIEVSAGLPGDANGDGFVDGGDYTIWADHFPQETALGISVGDFNLDGVVDGGDYTIWADNYAPAPALAAVIVESTQSRSVQPSSDSSETLSEPGQGAYLRNFARRAWGASLAHARESGAYEQHVDAIFSSLANQDDSKTWRRLGSRLLRGIRA